MGREDVIVELLGRYHEIAVTLNGPAGVAGDGDGVQLMPAAYTSSVRELERLIGRMRVERRSQWWHLTECYTRCTYSQRVGKMLRGRFVNVKPNERVISHPKGWALEVLREQSRRRTPVEVPIVVATWDPRVRAEKVRRGVEWLAVEWGLPHEPMIPKEVLAA